MSQASRKSSDTLGDFRAILKAPDAISNEYLPAYYDRLLPEHELKTFPPEVIEKLASKKGRTYIKGSNLLHRVLAREYGSPDVQNDPHFLRTQMFESDAWLLIHLMDEAADRLSRQGNYNGIVKAVEYADKLLFGKGAKEDTPYLTAEEKQAMEQIAGKLRTGMEAHGDMERFKPVWRALMHAALKETHSRSMKEYRTARQAVGEHSGHLNSFFVAGAGNEDYAAQHYGDRITGMRYSAKKIGAAAQLLDGYVDFNEDRAEVMREFTPKTGDRSWFLLATLRETAGLVLHEQRKHLGAFSGAVKVSIGKIGPQKTFSGPDTGTDRFIADLLSRAEQSRTQER